jgi:hypothetical protein
MVKKYVAIKCSWVLHEPFNKHDYGYIWFVCLGCGEMSA